jgi:hypothetical protein
LEDTVNKRNNLLSNTIESKEKQISFTNCVSNTSFSLNTENSKLLNSNHFNNKSLLVTNEYIKFVSDRARVHWKQIAREMDFTECQIVDIDRNLNLLNLNDKLYNVLQLWLSKNKKEGHDFNQYYVLNKLIEMLTLCRLNRIKGDYKKILKSFDFILFLLFTFLF